MIEKLRQEIVSLMKKQVPVQTQWVTVSSVDADANTMECKGVADDLEFYDVILSLGNFTKYPVVGTKALIGLISNQESLAFMIDCQEFTRCLIELESGFKLDLNEDEILLNGDAFGGLVKIDPTYDRITSLESKLNSLISKFNAHTHITTATVSATPTPGVIAPTVAQETTLTPSTSKTDLTNNNVKHG